MFRAAFARLWLACVLVAPWLGAGTAFGQEDQARTASYTHAPSQLVFPAELGGLSLMQVRDYETSRPGLGVGIKYGLENPKILADVYVYNAGRAVIPEGVGDPLVKGMFDRAVGDIREMGATGRYQNVDYIGEDRIALGDAPGARSILRARFGFTLEGAEVYSHVYLLAVHNHFVKLRFTYQREQAAQAQPLLGTALQALGKVVGSNVQ